ncbi:MAG: adenosylcobinamide-GDP ribazoletransferase [Kangiella sp.]|nr:MAG: adenosylcobinamide-GDP ribazoletransferase [Kangiella sp.]
MNKTEIKYELNLALIALTFFTRIPVSIKVDYSAEKLNQAGRYFSLIGILIGGLCALVYFIVSYFLSEPISLLLSMLFGILLTGSFHEDGLADTCDGFGGGWEATQKLKIMKDSRLGTYGAVALWFVLTLKFYLLLETPSIILALVIAHPLSRTLSTCMIYFLPYVTNEEQSKIKPLAEKLRSSDLVINSVIGITPLLLFSDLTLMGSVKVLLILTGLFFVLKRIYIKQIGGFTGDTLGAAQQISELVIYILLIVFI